MKFLSFNILLLATWVSTIVASPILNTLQPQHFKLHSIRNLLQRTLPKEILAGDHRLEVQSFQPSSFKSFTLPQTQAVGIETTANYLIICLWTEDKKLVLGSSPEALIPNTRYKEKRKELRDLVRGMKALTGGKQIKSIFLSVRNDEFLRLGKGILEEEIGRDIVQNKLVRGGAVSLLAAEVGTRFIAAVEPAGFVDFRRA